MTSEELTEMYQKNTLKEDYYWFSQGGIEFVGRLQYPTKDLIKARRDAYLPEPQKVITAFPGFFIGNLKTIKVLCPIPSPKKIRSIKKWQNIDATKL